MTVTPTPQRTITGPVHSRPITLSADKRKISYQGAGGKTVTLEVRDAGKAVESLRELSKRDRNNVVITKQQSGEDQIVVNDPGLLSDLYETLTFWCMEAVEVAVFGPYDEPRE